LPQAAPAIAPAAAAATRRSGRDRSGRKGPAAGRPHTRSITTTRALGSGSVGSSRRAGGRTGSTSGSSNGSGSHPGPSDSTPSQLSIGGHFTTPPRRKRIDRARAMLRNVPNQKLDPRDRHPYRFLEDI